MGQRALLGMGDALQKLAALLHNGEVGGELGVERRAARPGPGRRRPVAFPWPGQASDPGSPPGGPDGGGDLKDHLFGGIVESVEDGLRVVPLPQAATGQWVMHWPHRAQLASFIRRPPWMRTVVWAPEPVTSQAPRDWTRSQTDTQRRHLMHLELSHRMGSVGSQGRSVASLRKGTC